MRLGHENRLIGILERPAVPSLLRSCLRMHARPMTWPFRSTYGELHRPIAGRDVPGHDADGLRLRWLGTAGHVVETGTQTFLIDPYLSRPGLLDVAAKPLVPSLGKCLPWLPKKVDAIFCGHSHFDHILDAPMLAKHFGAQLFGSTSTLAFARAEGVPEELLIEVPPAGLREKIGESEVAFVPSKHGKLLFGQVPIPGEVLAPPKIPGRFFHYKMGGAFGIWLSTPKGALYHNGSADLVDAEVEPFEADVVLLGLAGRYATPRYIERVLRALGPRLVVPTHHDFFFTPMERGVQLLPGVQMPAFVRDVNDIAPRANIVAPTYADNIVVPTGEAHEAFCESYWPS